jgi:hypothetical protein
VREVRLIAIGGSDAGISAALRARELDATAEVTVVVDRRMQTSLPDVFAAGDCVVTHHRPLGASCLPLGTTAHKQGRVAGENALGGSREFVGSLGTQVVKVFDLVAARTGLRDHEAVEAGFAPLSVTSEADDRGVLPRQSPDHHALHRRSRHRTAGRRAARRPPRRRDRQADRLAYTPPLGSPWEALQAGAQAWTREAHGPHIDRHLSTSVD